MNKTRYWGLAVFSVIWMFAIVILNSAAGRAGTSYSTVMWAFVAFYAIKGNISKINSIAKWLSILQILVGALLFLWLAGDAGLQLYFGTPGEFLLSIGIPTGVWVAVYFWSSGKMISHPVNQPSGKLTETRHSNAAKSYQEKVASGESNGCGASEPQSKNNQQNVDVDHLTESVQPASQPPRPNRPEDVLLDYPRAKIAIEYRADIKQDWEEVRKLGEKYADMYLGGLDAAPDQKAADLLKLVKEEHDRDLRPFDDDNLNKHYMALEDYGEEAQKKFCEIHGVLGAEFDANAVASRIKEEYFVRGIATQQSLASLKAGLYIADKGSEFRKHPDQSVTLTLVNGRPAYNYYPTVEDFFTKTYTLSLTNVRRKND